MERRCPAVQFAQSGELLEDLAARVERTDRFTQRDSSGADHLVPDERLTILGDQPALVVEQLEVGQGGSCPSLQDVDDGRAIAAVPSEHHGGDDACQTDEYHRERREPNRVDEPAPVASDRFDRGRRQEREQPQRALDRLPERRARLEIPVE